MSILLVTLSADHTCDKCGQTIKAGEKAIKTKIAHRSCSATEFGTAFLHVSCWSGGGKGAKNGRT